MHASGAITAPGFYILISSKDKMPHASWQLLSRCQGLTLTLLISCNTVVRLISSLNYS